MDICSTWRVYAKNTVKYAPEITLKPYKFYSTTYIRLKTVDIPFLRQFIKYLKELMDQISKSFTWVVSKRLILYCQDGNLYWKELKLFEEFALSARLVSATSVNFSFALHSAISVSTERSAGQAWLIRF